MAVEVEDIYDKEISVNSSEKGLKLIGGKKFHRKPNLEEDHLWLFNLCLCFLTPFFCRLKPVVDEDIPRYDSRDLCSIAASKVKVKWEKKYLEYMNKLDVYNKNKSFNKNEEKNAFVLWFM
jgi:hypothetical protein